MKWTAVNPATEEVLREYPGVDLAGAEAIVEAAAKAQSEWRRTGFAHRSELMRRAGAILRERSDEFAELMTLEMGKPLREARGEVEKCAWVCEYYAEHAEGQLPGGPA